MYRPVGNISYEVCKQTIFELPLLAVIVVRWSGLLVMTKKIVIEIPNTFISDDTELAIQRPQCQQNCATKTSAGLQFRQDLPARS